jgi:hypothetical protein
MRVCDNQDSEMESRLTWSPGCSRGQQLGVEEAGDSEKITGTGSVQGTYASGKSPTCGWKAPSSSPAAGRRPYCSGHDFSTLHRMQVHGGEKRGILPSWNLEEVAGARLEQRQWKRRRQQEGSDGSGREEMET